MSCFLLVACGPAKTPADGGTTTPDSGSVQSACGQPGDMGNSLGVGHYCQTTADCASSSQAIICSSIVNAPTVTPQDDTFVCIIPECDPCAPPGTCGENAQCVCSPGLGGCGCFPTACPGVVSAFNATTTCMDGGSPAGDAGPGDAGPGDAGAGPGDAGPGPMDAGNVDAGYMDGGPGQNCYNACIANNMAAYQLFIGYEISKCGCGSGTCASDCTAECANPSSYSTSSACGTCIGNQENLGSSSSCITGAGIACEINGSCSPFISCSQPCP